MKPNFRRGAFGAWDSGRGEEYSPPGPVSSRFCDEAAISYENYDSTSHNYDQLRAPVGVGVILETLRSGGIDTSRSHLLDAGCGTGSYLYALKGSFARLVGLELNQGMLDKAKRKLENVDHISLHQGSIDRMPFRDGAFDAVIINQVIHHLDGDSAGSGSTWPTLQSALREALRALRAGGCLVINTCSQDQVFDGFWYTELVPQAVAKMARRYIPIADLQALMQTVGFHVAPSQVALQEMFSVQRFLDPTGPFEKSWRDGDSLWALATADELELGLARLRLLIQTGEVNSFLAERDQKRQRVGQATFVSGWKPK